MAHKSRPGLQQTYLVEHYRPDRDVAQLSTSIVRVREAISEMGRAGTAVRCVISMIVPNDESFLCLIEAASENVVADAYRRADVQFERISPAICVEDQVKQK
jgi:hypothetical protein